MQEKNSIMDIRDENTLRFLYLYFFSHWCDDGKKMCVSPLWMYSKANWFFDMCENVMFFSNKNIHVIEKSSYNTPLFFLFPSIYRYIINYHLKWIHKPSSCFFSRIDSSFDRKLVSSLIDVYIQSSFDCDWWYWDIIFFLPFRSKFAVLEFCHLICITFANILLVCITPPCIHYIHTGWFTNTLLSESSSGIVRL